MAWRRRLALVSSRLAESIHPTYARLSDGGSLSKWPHAGGLAFRASVT